MPISHLLGTSVANVSHVLGTAKANVSAILGATLANYFTDDFNTIDAAKWISATGGSDMSVVSSGGNLVIASDAAFSGASFGRLISANIYNGVGKTITIEGISSWIGGTGVDGQCFINFHDSATTGNQAQFELQANSNNLRAVVNNNFVGVESFTAAFQSANDTGLRIEHVNPGNTFKFYVKRSGVWTLFFTNTISPSWNLTSCRVRIQGLTNSGTGTPNKSFTAGNFDSDLS